MKIVENLTSFIKQAPIGKKIGILSGFLIALLAISLGYVCIDLTRSNGVIKDQLEILTVQENVTDISKEFSNINYWLTDLGLSFLTSSQEHATTSKNRIDQLMANVEKTHPELAAKVQPQIEKYHECMLKAVDAYVKENRVLGNALLAKCRDLSIQISKQLDTLVAEAREDAHAAGQTVLDRNASIRSFAFLFLLAAIGLGIFLTQLISNILTRPITETMDVLEKVARGDLTPRLNPDTRDEVGRMGIAVDFMAENLNQSINQISEASKDIASTAEQLSTTSKQMATGADTQTGQTESVASSMEEMSATVQQVAQNASAAAKKARGSEETASKGGERVEATIQGINAISSSVSDLQMVIKTLSDQSTQIGNIIGVIDDVADQTNLLALNAAIEAARAGDQGRGFAVVADEVRKLAERTTQLTKEISKTVKSIQSGTMNAVSSMETSVTQVNEGVGLAEMAGNSLKEIVSGVRSVQQMVDQIATSAEQQSSTTLEISTNVESIASVAKQTAAGTKQTTTASHDLSELASTLQSLVTQFKLKNQKRDAPKPVEFRRAA